MKFKKLTAFFVAALMIAAFSACSNNNEPQSESDFSSKSSQAEESSVEKSPEEIAEEVGYVTFEEITAEGYYPSWMQPNTVIVYDENGAAEIAEGGELAPEELVGRDDIASVGFSTVGDEEMKIEPNTKVEYDLHGFIQNIYHLWPDGSYNLDYPPEG